MIKNNVYIASNIIHIIGTYNEYMKTFVSENHW